MRIRRKLIDCQSFSGASCGPRTSFVDFRNCDFPRATFFGRISSTTFVDCSFPFARFVDLGMAKPYPVFTRCTFDHASFKEVGWDESEFEDCSFLECSYTGTARLFPGTGFRTCRFIGTLEGVAFGGRVGGPRRSAPAFENVDFSDATLLSVGFGGGRDLSSVRLPRHGCYGLYDRWQERMAGVRALLARTAEPIKKEIEVYLAVNRSPRQEWMIVNLDELIGEYGEEAAQAIIDALGVPAVVSG